jgi:hypothetical protein
MTIMRKQGKQVASLRPEDINSRYHLPTPTCSLNEPFLKGFSQASKGPAKKMKHWWDDEYFFSKRRTLTSPERRRKPGRRKN